MNEGLKVFAHGVHRCCVSFKFFVFVILSNQNACNGCENAENRTWSEFFHNEQKFPRQCVNVIEVYLFFNVWKILTNIVVSVCNDLKSEILVLNFLHAKT